MSEASKPELKVAHVFDAKLSVRKGVYQRPKRRDWNSSLSDLAENLVLGERKIDGIYYDPVEHNGVYLLGMHRPIDPSFMSHINENSHSITDYVQDDEGVLRLASSSVVLFSETKHVFIYAAGPKPAPPPSAVGKFLDRFFPGEEGQKWKIEPYLDHSQIDRLKEADGLINFSSKFSTRRDLFSSDTTSEGPAGYADRIADAVGQDVQIEIKISLPKQSRGAEAMKNFLDLIKGDLHRTVPEGSNARATALLEEGLEEELGLVAQKMTKKFEIEDSGSKSKTFSDLMRGISGVSDDLNASIKEIETG